MKYTRKKCVEGKNKNKKIKLRKVSRFFAVSILLIIRMDGRSVFTEVIRNFVIFPDTLKIKL